MRTIHKEPVDPARVRELPHQFGAVDRKLIYDGVIRTLTPLEGILYLLLICVADPEGLSYYSERRLAEMLNVDRSMVVAARDALVRKDLILYRAPIYQLLTLPVRP